MAELIPMGSKGQGPRKGRSVKLHPQTWQALAVLAEERRQSVNYVVERMLEKGLDRCVLPPDVWPPKGGR